MSNHKIHKYTENEVMRVVKYGEEFGIAYKERDKHL